MVSICLPSMNGAAYLGEAIESVLSQKCPNFELLVGDNASNDNTFQVASSYQDKRLRVIRYSERLEMCANWNRLIAEAGGHWIKLLPCDDRLTPGALEREVSAIADGVVLIAGGKILCGRSGRRIRTFRRVESGRHAGQEFRKQLLSAPGNLLGEPGSVLFRRHDWDLCGGFNESLHFYCDVEFYLRLLGLGDLVFLKQPSALFRAHGGSMSSSLFRKVAKDFYRFRSIAGVPPAGLLLKISLWFSIATRQATIKVLDRF
jgi:glycosyltransferase involved in cell wall biosynthesis